ncbi:hypothetical protein ACIBQX_11510 [Nonomuraea sp. NPDC049714]|uniref:hypothetical protein n=1 Tax=Nonomuraea sp. NPDC049714 TaxID=3364357 RepID=UPI0037AF332F
MTYPLDMATFARAWREWTKQITAENVDEGYNAFVDTINYHLGLKDRPNLKRLIGKWVMMTTPQGLVWVGRLSALHNRPTMVIDLPDGTSVLAPQDFAISQVDPPPEQEMAWKCACGCLTPGRWQVGAVCAGCGNAVEHPEAQYRLVPPERTTS